MEDDWDLHAVVRRGCTTSSSYSSSSYAAASSARGEDGGYEPKDEPFLGTTPQVMPSERMTKDFVVGGVGGSGELHELCRPFFAGRSNLPFVLQNSCFSPVGEFGFDCLSWFETHQHGDSVVERSANKSGCSVRGSSGPCAAATPQSSRSKRKKNQMKKVCHVPAESLNSDIWAWRKYGQKPIKGSPYPRGYYRCSSSKGCFARKQVERDKSDPGMFIVTYTAEHNHPAPTHRNLLAGSIRQKLATPRDDASNNVTESKTPFPSTQPCFPSSSPATTSSPEEEAAHRTSVNTESAADDEDEGDVGFSGLVIADDDDFGVGFEGGPLGEDDYEDSFFDQFPANFGRISWSSNNTTASAGRS